MDKMSDNSGRHTVDIAVLTELVLKHGLEDTIDPKLKNKIWLGIAREYSSIKGIPTPTYKLSKKWSNEKQKAKKRLSHLNHIKSEFDANGTDNFFGQENGEIGHIGNDDDSSFTNDTNRNDIDMDRNSEVPEELLRPSSMRLYENNDDGSSEKITNPLYEAQLETVNLDREIKAIKRDQAKEELEHLKAYNKALLQKAEAERDAALEALQKAKFERELAQEQLQAWKLQNSSTTMNGTSY